MEVTLIIFGIATAVLIAFFLPKFIKRRQFVNTVNRIPGPKSYPIIGTMWDFIGANREDIFDLKRKYSKQFDGIYRLWTVGFADIKLERPEYIEQLLKSPVNIAKSPYYEMELKKWLGNGLLTSFGQKWFSHRKLISSSLHMSVLEGFIEVFVEKSQIMVEKLAEFGDTGKVVDVFDHVLNCALDIICETSMGVHLSEDERIKYITAIQEILAVNTQRFLNPFLHNEWIFALTSYGARSRKALKTLHDFTDKVIEERMEMRKQISTDEADFEHVFGKKHRKAFLDLFLDEFNKGEFFTKTDVKNEVDAFMFAGHDTTAITTANALYFIGLYPEVQEKLYQEQLEVFGNFEELPTMKTLNELQYMDRVMKECIRLIPTVTQVSRRVSEEFEVAGYTIPVGATVSIGIYACSHDERYFPDPEKFDPDRFLPENKEKLHPFSFIPFSAGVRNCIGQKYAQLKEKMLLLMMIRNFKFTSVDSRENMKYAGDILSKPIYGVKLLLEKRH
ncbi:cytochrome P450 4C1-like [Culicoides brevitarsis]|uniref:cytochrome P450 4C1-like n=1 Tax=Culicoides brevitarsis TaxID=469753 RepID=UPI00307B69ED